MSSAANLKLNVLVLEDSQDDASLLVRKLSKEGSYEISFEVAQSLETLKSALDRKEWNLIISDHSMPQFTAINALEELHARKLDIPVIIVSGTIEPEAAVAAMKAGASDFIMKDDLTRLLPAIERELRAAQSRREQRSTEKQLQQAQKIESIGRLAGGVAHDFNNILTAISGYSHFLLGSLSPDDPNRADVEEIKKAGERAASLTRQLLAFSRQQVLQPRVLDLNVLVRDIEKMLQRLIGEDIDLAAVLGKDLGRIKADPGQIEQVLLNLVVNARDAMPEGGKITIETSDVDLGEEYTRDHPDVRPGPHVMLAVSDAGVGMDSKTMSHLFEPFFTTKEKGKGTGLGLSTVYGIVKQSGGSIFVYSEPGRGSAFKIYLPASQEAAEPRSGAPAAAVSSGGRETILLVEDDDMVRKFVQRVLAQSGYTLLSVPSPKEAIELCERQKGRRIHLLLTDIVMPGMRGDELAKRLSSARPDMKVVFTSGYTEAGAARSGLSSPDVVFVQKPIDADLLIRKIRETLDAPGTGKS